MDCFSAHVGSRPVVNQPKHCVNQLRSLTRSLLFFEFYLRTSRAIWGDAVEAKRERSLWGCDLSYRDKLSLWVDVHSPGGVPSGQGEGEGLRCPPLDRPRRWASALMAPEGETVSWIHVHMYTHTHTSAPVPPCQWWSTLIQALETHISGMERTQASSAHTGTLVCDVCSLEDRFSTGLRCSRRSVENGCYTPRAPLQQTNRPLLCITDQIKWHFWCGLRAPPGASPRFCFWPLVEVRKEPPLGEKGIHSYMYIYYAYSSPCSH